MQHFIFPSACILLLAFYTSCQTETPVPAATPTDLTPLVKQYFEHFNRHDWPAMAAMYAEPAQMQDPSMGLDAVPQTRAQIVEKYSALQTAIPDVKDQVKAMYQSGDQHVTVLFESSGTGPDGQPFRLPICTVFKIENGLITADLTYYDNF